MTRLPYHRYLLWLHLCGDTREQILTKLEELSFPAPSEGILHEYTTLASNTPLSLMCRRRLARGEYHANDAEIISRLGLRELYLMACSGMPAGTWSVHDSETYAVVQRVLDNPVARVAIDCAVICGVKFDELKQLVSYSFAVELTQAALDVYFRVYFDHALQSKLSWREYLKLMIRDPYCYVRYMAALTAPKDEVLHLVGLPTKPAFSNFLKKVLSKAEYKFTYYSSQNTLQGDDTARKWAKLGIEAGVKHEVFAKADITDFSAVLQTEFEFVEESIPMVSGEMLAEIKPAPSDAATGSAPPPPTLFPDLEP